MQQGAGIVGDGAGEGQIVQHEEIAIDDVSQPDLALRDGAQCVTVEKVIGLEVLDLVALQDRLIGNRLGDVRFPGARLPISSASWLASSIPALGYGTRTVHPFRYCHAGATRLPLSDNRLSKIIAVLHRLHQGPAIKMQGNLRLVTMPA